MTRAVATCAAFIAACTWAAPAPAQQYLIGADAAVSSGIEGGGAPGLFRTRTRLRLGADLRVDEFPEDILEVGLLAEVEPHAGVGLDVRYARAAGEHIVFDAGAVGILAPASLYGVVAGVTYRLPLSKRVQITLGPEGDFYVLGTDLPDRTIVWQVRVQGGVRVEL